jgi:hypothetical protein
MCIINISYGTKLYFLYMYIPPISIQLYLCLKQMRHTLQAFNVNVILILWRSIEAGQLEYP